MEHALKEQLGPTEQDVTEHRWGSVLGPAWLQGGIRGGAGRNMAGESGQEAGGGGLGGGGRCCGAGRSEGWGGGGGRKLAKQVLR